MSFFDDKFDVRTQCNIAAAHQSFHNIMRQTMKKLLLTALALGCFNVNAASSPSVDQAMAELNLAYASYMNTVPAALQEPVGNSQNQWIAWAQQDCNVRTGQPISQRTSLFNEPFGNCMVNQMQVRTAQLKQLTKR